jgi:PAT family beta-lactamase induction signal transducer AmpG
MAASPKGIKHPALWVPTSYLAEGIPFAMANWVAGTLLKDLGHTDGSITAVTGAVGIAWSLKPLWAAFLDTYRSKKFFVLATEVILAVLLGAMAFSLKVPGYFVIIAGILWVMAFSSATQDICVDGVYITSLDKQRQSAWMGWQSGAWNGGRFFGTSLIVGVASYFITHLGFEKKAAWTVAMMVAAATMGALALYHSVVLPSGSKPVKRKVQANDAAADKAIASSGLRFGVGIGGGVLIGLLISTSSSMIVSLLVGLGTAVSIIIGWREHVPPALDFFKKKSLWGMLIFVFLYRSGEGFLLQEGPLFIQSSVAQGGLGLTLAQKVFADGTLGTIMSIAGALLGGWFVALRGDLRRSLFILALSMNIPHLCYIILSHAVTPAGAPPLWFIYTLYSIEKLGYNFGFVGNMLYMMQQLAPGRFKMTHYAFATALMNLVLWPTQTFSGRLADWMGYKSYFIFVLVASIPSVIAAWKAPFPNPPDVEEEGEGEAPPAPPAPRPVVA